MIVIGVDPDSKKHGIAIYRNGKLTNLDMMNNVEFIDVFRPDNDLLQTLVSIEDVCANNFVYARNNKGSKAQTSKIAMGIGRCQQAQTELMRWLDHYKVEYVLHKPQKGNWADNRKQFEQVTGWKGQSNADTRSAAYFGFLAINNHIS